MGQRRRVAHRKVIPAGIAEIADAIRSIGDRQERIEALIALANRFREVLPEIASRPFPEANRVPACESQAYVFAVPSEQGIEFHFAVENPQGVSAKAMAALLQRASGAPLDQILNIPEEIVYVLFGRELSMGKSAGLMEMIRMLKVLAKQVSPLIR